MAWRYDWDAAKRQSNLAKHGIDFAVGVAIFEDPDLVERPSGRRFDEERRKVIGRVNDGIWIVIYTRRGDVRRLISARRASRRERRTYYAGDRGI